LLDYINAAPERADLKALRSRLESAWRRFCTPSTTTIAASVESAIGLIAYKLTATATTKTIVDAHARANLPVSTRVWMAPQSFEYQLTPAKSGNLKQLGATQSVNTEFFAFDSGSLVRAFARGKIEVADSADQIVLDFDDSGLDLTAESRVRLASFLAMFSKTRFALEDWVVLLPPSLQGSSALARDRRMGAIRAQTISLAVADNKLPASAIILPDLSEPSVLDPTSVKPSQAVLKRTGKNLVAAARAPINQESLPVISTYIFQQ
jgi:hypothetical protein